MSHRADVRKRDDGFTLVETLVSLAVASIVIAAAAGSFAFVTQGPRRADDRLRLALAQDLLMFDIRRKAAPWIGETSGSAGTVEWRAIVTDRASRAADEGRFRPMSIDLRLTSGTLAIEGRSVFLSKGGSR